MKKVVVAGLSVLGVSSLFAATGTNVLENVTAVANGVQSAVGDAATAAAPVIVAVIGVGIALWIIPSIVGICKRAFGSGKGR